MLLHNIQTDRSRTNPTVEEYSKNKYRKHPRQGTVHMRI